MNWLHPGHFDFPDTRRRVATFMASSGGEGEDRPAVTGLGWPRWRTDGPARFDEAGTGPEALTATFVFEPRSGRHPSSATVRFAGHRVGVVGPKSPRDRFVQEEIIDGVVPRSGPVSITARIHGLNPGEWAVTAELVPPPSQARSRWFARGLGQRSAQVLRPAAWSWRHGRSPRPSAAR